METRSTSTSRPTRRLPRPRTEYPGTSPEPNPRATIYAPCPTAKAQVSEPVGHGAPGSVSMDWVAPVSTALPHYRTRGADRRWFELPADRLSWRRDRAGQSLDARRRLYGDYTAALSRMRTALNECAQTNIRVLRDTRDLLLRSPEPGARRSTAMATPSWRTDSIRRWPNSAVSCVATLARPTRLRGADGGLALTFQPAPDTRQLARWPTVAVARAGEPLLPGRRLA